MTKGNSNNESIESWENLVRVAAVMCMMVDFIIPGRPGKQLTLRAATLEVESWGDTAKVLSEMKARGYGFNGVHFVSYK